MKLEELISIGNCVDGFKSALEPKKLWMPPGGRSVFGGQIVAQAIESSGMFLLKEESGIQWDLHSLHSYFINPGKMDQIMQFNVLSIRRSKSFNLLRVTALQKDVVVFECQLSYCIKGGGGCGCNDVILEHQTIPSEVKELMMVDPSTLESAKDLLKRFKMEESGAFCSADFENVDIRFTSKKDNEDLFTFDNDPISGDLGKRRSPTFSYWIKIDVEDIDRSTSSTLSLSLSALMTDHLILSTAARPSAKHIWNPSNCLLASLDHCMWFTGNEIKCNEWNLFHCHSPSSSNGGRGLTVGNLYSLKDGGKKLLTVVQEGIIRVKTTN